MKVLGQTLGFVLGWYILLSAPLAAPPLVATALLLVVALAFWWRYFDGGAKGVPLARRARFRIRPLGPAFRPLLRCAAVLIVFDLAALLTLQYVAHVPDQGSSFLDTYIAQHPLGWLPISFIVVIGGPFVEEFGFRALLQRPMEKRWGPLTAITLTSLAFAAAHADPWHAPYFFMAGVVLGTVVWITRSIWASIILHVIHNGVTILLSWLLPDDRTVDATLIHYGARWIAPIVAIATGIVVVRLLRALPRGGAVHNHARAPRDSVGDGQAAHD